MITNTQHLQYLIEIERTRSISQAATNLYMGQPNLSRILRDTEASVGFAIFERTRRGVRPTEKGTVFLQHARNILREVDFIDRMGPGNAESNRFRICLPRSYHYVATVQEYLSGAHLEKGLDAIIRECHPRRALELLDGGYAEISIIRYCVEYQDYFSEQASAKELSLLPLSTLKYLVTLCVDHPLAKYNQLTKDNLSDCIELVHRDDFSLQNKKETLHKQIYTVDRMSQIQLLQRLSNTYLWSEKLPASMLSSNQIEQLPCIDNETQYQDMIAYKPQCAMSMMEKDFLRFLVKKEGIQEPEAGSRSQANSG